MYFPRLIGLIAGPLELVDENTPVAEQTVPLPEIMDGRKDAIPKKMISLKPNRPIGSIIKTD